MGFLASQNGTQNGIQTAYSKLIRPLGALPTGRAACTHLSSHDTAIVLTAMAFSYGFKGDHLNAGALELALEALVTEMPFLAGRLLNGQEPLLKVRLTQLQDGDILSFTLCHVITDGTRWPRYAAHLAALYRHFAGREVLDLQHLLQPCDRRMLSPAHMATQLLGEDAASWRPAEYQVRPSLAGYWRLGKLLLKNAWQQMELMFLHIPQQQVADLKKLAAAEGGPGAPAITTGDAVQAACALLMHAAKDLPLLPVAPYNMRVLAQLPTPPGYCGNATRMLPVSLPAGTQQPAGREYVAALCQLAGAIRQATAAFRTQPEEVLAALVETEALVSVPAPRMLAYLGTRFLPRLSCTTNYLPQHQAIDLGRGHRLAHVQEMTMPRARDMVVIRPAVTPCSEGLFAQLCLPLRAAARLRQHPLLAALLPGASFV